MYLCLSYQWTGIDPSASKYYVCYARTHAGLPPQHVGRQVDWARDRVRRQGRVVPGSGAGTAGPLFFQTISM